MIRKLYPGGKKKAFNISYDDGILQDVRFVELLNKYGIKGTFNLNSGLMKREFEWVHECGLAIKRLPESAVVELYRGHEVASHTYSHPYMDDYTEDQILQELGADRFFLERLFGQEVVGYATPFYFYSDLVAKCVRNCGFEYARISEVDPSYEPRTDYYHWRGNLFHESPEMEAIVEGFLNCDVELAVCQIVGHSYDLDVHSMWDRMENVIRSVSGHDEVWPATHLELVRYLRQMEKAVITPEFIRNDSAAELWFSVNGTAVKLQPGEEISLV